MNADERATFTSGDPSIYFRIHYNIQSIVSIIEDLTVVLQSFIDNYNNFKNGVITRYQFYNLFLPQPAAPSNGGSYKNTKKPRKNKRSIKKRKRIKIKSIH